MERRYGRLFIFALLGLWVGLTSCGHGGFGLRHCPDAEIDYVHALKWDDISYTRNYESDLTMVKAGEMIGQVGYELADHACSDYRMKNGDATLLQEGTAIFRVVGYKPEYRLMANGQLYEVSDNPRAKTMTDLYDVRGRITKVGFESTGDGSYLSDFTEAATAGFADRFLALPYVGAKGIGERYKGDHLFLRVTLKDGSSFRIGFWPESGALTPGAVATDELRQLILGQWQSSTS